MRRILFTIVVSATLLVAGALVPEDSGVQTPAAPLAAPANANLV